MLKRYLRLAVMEARDARVPDQLVTDKGHEGEEEGDDVREFAAAGGGGNAIGSGNVVGYSGGLGVDPDDLGRKKDSGKRKRSGA